jgi:homoserine kinase
MHHRIRVFAPATVANLGPGFDVLGLALSTLGDVVEAEPRETEGVEIVEITGDGGALPMDPEKNVAGRAAADVLRRAGSSGRGIRLWLRKKMPLASGLGSSGASSAAGAVAANELLGRPLSQKEVVESAMEGEVAASGSPHADNVAPSVMGGIVLVRSYDPFEVIRLPVPAELRVTVVHPHCAVSTADARRLLQGRQYPLAEIVANVGNVAALVAALHSGDLELLGRTIVDRLVEPLRAGLIPGFDQVKKAALDSGALGCSIAGSGPSVFAFARGEDQGRRIGQIMQQAFRASAGLESDLFVDAINATGARLLTDSCQP